MLAAFGTNTTQNASTGSSLFGGGTSGAGSLFGTTNTSTATAGAGSGMFGAAGSFVSQGGTVVKFVPPPGSDTMLKGGTSSNINTRHQCITAMKEYETKSLEVRLKHNSFFFKNHSVYDATPMV